VAVRVWNADTRFANFKIDGKEVSFTASIPKSVSLQWDAIVQGDAKC
jgi:hypothetical protein